MRAAAVALLVVFIGGGLYADCDPSRGTVRAATDIDAVFVNVHPIPSSIASLGAIGAVRPLSQDRRASSVELTIYRVGALLTSVRRDEDTSYHLLISDGARTMIAELPPAGCTEGSVFAIEMATARARL